MEVPSLARSWKLQEHVWETGSVLAPGTSLRLEVTLLAACLRVESPKVSLSWLCLRSMWIEALLVTMRFLRTQIGNCRIWSDWKCKGFLPLVVDQKRLSGGFCLNSLDILSVESVEMDWKDWF